MTTIKIKKIEFKKLFDVACTNWKTKFAEKLDFFSSSDSFEFEESFLQEMKQACTAEQKPIFNKMFGKYLKEEIDLFKIKTYKEVCKKLKEKELTINDFKFLAVEYRKKALASTKLQQIEKLFNGSWVKDFNNSNQRKYYPYFEKRSSGWLVHSVHGYRCSSRAGAAFYKDEQTAKYCGSTFINIYSDLH